MTLWWLLFAMTVPAQADAADPCAVPGACRRIETVRIETPSGTVLAVPVDKTLPWIAQDNLMLFPGDSATVRLVERNGGLFPELVRSGAASAATPPADGQVRVTVAPYALGKLTMTVESRWSVPLDYGALIVIPLPGKTRAERTSVCTLLPGKTNYELWNRPILQLALSSFRPTTQPGCKTIDARPTTDVPAAT
ncbi:hypothetical protein [uncultured Sphingomonas sp.]|uniref:hypothetical protein n=1 Tax=uncultured Sphingomonas sp. TaxID=158754 RepID=UPI0035CB0CEF